MATCFGKLDKDERMEYYFLVNEITSSDKKQALFVSAMGAKSYKLLMSLITTAAPSNKLFRKLVESLIKHFALHSLKQSNDLNSTLM